MENFTRDLTATALYSGIQNIARMREETRVVILTIANVFGTVSRNTQAISQFHDLCTRYPQELKLLELKGQWLLDCSNIYGTERNWTVALKHTDLVIYQFRGGDYSEPPKNRVAEIHKNLNLFVQGMVEKFPALQESLQAFFDAADA
jgi:hypothetical protein